MSEELSCAKLLEIAKDEWETFKDYFKLPEPFKTFAMDELKHFSHAAIMLRERCPKERKELDELMKV